MSGWDTVSIKSNECLVICHRKTSEWATPALRIIAGLKTVDMLIVEICQLCGGTVLQQSREEWCQIWKGKKKIFFWYMSFNSQQKNASWHGCHLEFKNSALWQRIMKLRIWLVDYKLLFWLNKIHMVSILADWVILVSLSFFFSWVNWEREREGARGSSAPAGNKRGGKAGVVFT